jgi:hypothetical protein
LKTLVALERKKTSHNKFRIGIKTNYLKVMRNLHENSLSLLVRGGGVNIFATTAIQLNVLYLLYFIIYDKNNKYLRIFIINHKNTINIIYFVGLLWWQTNIL